MKGTGMENGKKEKGIKVLKCMSQIKLWTIDFLTGMLLISFRVLGVCFIL